MNVRIKELEFGYPNFSLNVRDLSFEASKISSLVGPNGAGKTTLLKCIGGVLPVEEGELYLNGKDLSLMKGRERAQHIGYVPQEYGSTFNYHVRDFVLMGRAAYLSLFSTPSKEDVRIAEEALEYVGLINYSHRYYFELSSGERRLVLIARALAQKPDILLLDEPTSFLDPKHEVEIMDLTARLAKEMKKTILITLHNLDLAIQYSDSIFFMKKGTIFAFGKPAEILNESLLENVYEIKMKIVEYDGRKFIVK
jgi:iron complex transport system ATP-binding protein